VLGLRFPEVLVPALLMQWTVPNIPTQLRGIFPMQEQREIGHYSALELVGKSSEL